MDKILVIASAGGHLTQALCATFYNDNIVLVSEKINVKKNDRIKRIYKIWHTQFNPFVHFFNIFFAIFIIIKEKPKAVFSTGGPIVLPFALVCKFLPIKFVFLDTLSRVYELSNSGKMIKKYNLYDEFYSQWPEIAKKNDVDYIGKSFDILSENNVNIDSDAVMDEPKIPLILVTIGTSDYLFTRAIKKIESMPLYKDERVSWVIQAGHNKIINKPANGNIVSLVGRDEMDAYVKTASLVISHCGIGSINQMLAYQKRTIFIPRVKQFDEFSDDHQLQIASQLDNPLFDVIGVEDDIPLLSYDDLISTPRILEPVDIINYSVSQKITDVLTSK